MSKMDIVSPSPHGLAAGTKPCRDIPTTELDGAAPKFAFSLWQELRGNARYPSRRQVTPRNIKPILRNVALVKVVDQGADYEFRVAGDAFVMAHSVNLQGQIWSKIGSFAPGLQAFVKPIYDRVVQGGEPVALRGWLVRGNKPGSMIFGEFVCLPLGEPDGEVDHILIAAAYGSRDGIETGLLASSSFSA